MDSEPFEIDFSKEVAIPLKARGHDFRKMPSIPIPETEDTSHFLHKRGFDVSSYMKKFGENVILIIVLPTAQQLEEVERNGEEE